MRSRLGLVASLLLAGCPQPRPIGSPSGSSPDAVAPPSGPAPARDGLPAGSSCVAAEDCASGICEGEGCTPDAPGQCVDPTRMCTRDLEAYCDCDGETFHGSGSCPGKRYAHDGPCPGDPPLIGEIED